MVAFRGGKTANSVKQAIQCVMGLFDTLGFQWDRNSVPREMPRASVGRVVFRFHRMLPEYVWDAGVLEGNPFTFPEVKTLLEGVTVGGRKLSDQEQILNLGESSKYLAALAHSFPLSDVTARSAARLENTCDSANATCEALKSHGRARLQSEVIADSFCHSDLALAGEIRSH
jgi:hypothetical protein